MNFQIPIIGGIVTFFLVLILNIVNGNSFLMLFVRSLISAVLVFGVLFGVFYVFKDILKIDINATEKGDVNTVDVSVGDEQEDMEKSTVSEDLEKIENESPALTPEDVNFSRDEDLPYEEGEKKYTDEDIYEESYTSTTNSKKNMSVKDILGYDASAEDLAKAIKTKLGKEE